MDQQKIKGFLHTMDMGSGQKRELLEFNSAPAFGRPGHDYSETFSVTCEPLYTASPVARSLLATIDQLSLENERLCSSLKALEVAARAAMEEAIDGAVVHPCDEHSEDAKAKTLAPAFQDLYRVICEVTLCK